MSKNLDEEVVYTLKDTVKLTGLSIDLVRLYEKEFNLQIQRTEGATEDIISPILIYLLKLRKEYKSKIGVIK